MPPRSPPTRQPTRSGSLWSSEGEEVTVVALASLKGSPGVTTAATALGRQLAQRAAGSSWSKRIPSAATWLPAMAWRPTGRLWPRCSPRPGGPPPRGRLGPRRPSPRWSPRPLRLWRASPGAVANEKAWPVVAEALGALDADVVVDVGRLLPQPRRRIGDVLAHSDALVVLCHPTLEAIVHLRPACPAWLLSCVGGGSSSSPPARAAISAADIGTDPGGRGLPADARRPVGQRPRWPTSALVKRLERTALLRWAADAHRGTGHREPAPKRCTAMQWAPQQGAARSRPRSKSPTQVTSSTPRPMSTTTRTQRPPMWRVRRSRTRRARRSGPSTRRCPSEPHRTAGRTR